MTMKKTTTIMLEGWLARSKLMGYEIFSEKPEPIRGIGEFQWKMLDEFKAGAKGLYIHLGSTHISMSSPLHLAQEKTKRISITLEVSARKHKSVTVEATPQQCEEKATIGKMSKHNL